MSLFPTRRHAAVGYVSRPAADTAEAPPAPAVRTVPFFGGTIRGAANVAVYVHPSADLAQLAYARGIIDAEMEARR